MDGLAVSNTGGPVFYGPIFRCGNIAFAVDGLTNGIDDTADHRFANGHLHDAARTAHAVSLFDLRFTAEKNGADIVLFQVEHHAEDVVGKLQEFAGHSLFQPVNASDTVTHLDDCADVVHIEIYLISFNLLFDNRRNFFGPHFHTQPVTPILVPSLLKSAFSNALS